MYTMRVIYVEPDLAPRIIDIPHTLPDMQTLVGGMIEIVELSMIPVWFLSVMSADAMKGNQ